MNKLKREDLVFAFCVAMFPPLWAVAAPYISVSTGAVALICAGVHGTHPKGKDNALKIAIGFLFGDLWALMALTTMNILNLPPDFELFLTLFVLGGLGVIVSTIFSKFIFTPSLLCGWAIGLTIMAPIGYGNLGSMPIQIGVAMLVGVFYIGNFMGWIQGKILKFGKK